VAEVDVGVATGAAASGTAVAVGAVAAAGTAVAVGAGAAGRGVGVGSSLPAHATDTSNVHATVPGTIMDLQVFMFMKMNSSYSAVSVCPTSLARLS